VSSVELRAPPSRLPRIAAIFVADVRSWTREKVFFILSFLGVFIYAGISFLMPDVVDESFRIGVRMPAGAPSFLPDEEGLEIVRFETTEALVAELKEGERDILVGLDFADDTVLRVAQGLPPLVNVHVSPKAPPELTEAARVMVTELAYAAVGKPLPVTMPDEKAVVVGEDKVGKQASLRARMRPMAALLVLALELMSIASLVSKDLMNRTVVAVLATPATVADWVMAKVLFGAFVAFIQAFLLLTLIGAIFVAPLELTLLVVLGTLLYTGLGLVAGAQARDFTEVLFYAFALLMPTVIPAFAVLLPGSTSPFVKFIPTYPLALAIFDASNGAPFSVLLPNMLWVGGWVFVLLTIGIVVVTRRVRQL
jgi:ABC-2 type transport system permease protein